MADAALLIPPLRSLVDIEEIERVPFDQRLRIDSYRIVRPSEWSNDLH